MYRMRVCVAGLKNGCWCFIQREVNEDMRLWYDVIDAAVPFFTGCVIVLQFLTKTSEVTSLFNRESLTSSTRESHTTNCPLYITTTRTGSSNADLLKSSSTIHWAA